MKQLGLFFALLLSSCSVNRYAINKLGDVLAGAGSTFASDDDPELIRAAVPFSLKLIESLLAENPKHAGLLLAAAQRFTEYAYAFGPDYGLRGIEVKHPGFAERRKANPKEAVKELKKIEAALMYWTAISWGAALLASHDFAMIPEIPRFEALIDRVLEVDEAFDEGTAHAFHDHL
jgi:hypothetical protein